MRPFIISILVALAAPVGAQTPAALALSVDPGASSATYHLIHKMHKVDGISKQLSGKAAVSPEGKAQAQRSGKPLMVVVRCVP